MPDAPQAQAGDPVIRVTRLSKTYSARVVDGVDWSLRRGRVHALLGGNGSGKSTLLKMLAGVVAPDHGGTIDVGDRSYPSEHYSVAVARQAGLRFVHQDLGLVDDLSIADNFALALGYPRTPWRTIDRRKLFAGTQAQLRRFGLGFDPRLPAGALRPTERALVAIARALDGIDAGEATLVLDEPTASLPVGDVERVFEAIRRLRADGHSVVFVSHRMSEVEAIADDVTVLRDGRVVGSGAMTDFSADQLVELIAGHAVALGTAPAPGERQGTPALVVRSLSAGPLSGVDLDVAEGEIVGIAGLAGSGRSSLLRALFGDLPSSGTVTLGGVPVRLARTRDAVRHGIALVPEDRQREAAFVDRPVWENLSAAVLRRYRRGPWLSARRERADAPQAMRAFSVRAPGPDAPLGALSGGNQQKVILARWLRAEPRLLLLDEPTQGVDAVARDEIHRLVRDAARRGCAILVVSSDVDELAALAQRAIILQRGRVTSHLGPDRMRADVIAAAVQDGRAATSSPPATLTPPSDRKKVVA